MPKTIGTTMNENKDAGSFVVSLSNHEQPFDRLRANGSKPIFVLIV
jgi:hypothetical protein